MTETTPETTYSRRRFIRTGIVLSGLTLGVAATGPVSAEPPGFDGRIYADDEVWATKGVADLPRPTDNNDQSYDKLFPSPGTDLIPVGEAAPGNPDYNAGRWAVHPLTWGDNEPKQLKSYREVQAYASKEIIGFPEVAVDAFECPLIRMND